MVKFKNCTCLFKKCLFGLLNAFRVLFVSTVIWHFNVLFLSKKSDIKKLRNVLNERLIFDYLKMSIQTVTILKCSSSKRCITKFVRVGGGGWSHQYINVFAITLLISTAGPLYFVTFAEKRVVSCQLSKNILLWVILKHKYWI